MSYEQDNHCPECFQTRKGFEQIQVNYKRHLKCNKCAYTFDDDETTKAYGLQKCKDGSYESNGDKYMLFPCEYCMIFFLIWDEKVQHVRSNHEIGDEMACMIK